MKNVMRGALLALGLATVGAAHARSDVRDGNAMVTPAKGDKYSIDGATMGKAELYGYMGDLRDREHLTGIVLKRGGNDEQRHVVGSIARTLQLKAFEQDGRDLKPIDLPPTTPVPAPPPIDGKPAVPAPPATPPPGH
jgi:hypothetical protein